MRNIATAKWYVGVSVDPQRRFRQHAANPPQRMRQDIDRHTPFQQQVELHVFDAPPAQFSGDAHALEREWIKIKDSRAHGYNKLDGDPAQLRQFYAMRRMPRPSHRQPVQQITVTSDTDSDCVIVG